MNIAYTTIYNPKDLHSWSGLGFNIASSIESQNVKIDYIGNLDQNLKYLRLGMQVKKLIYNKLNLGNFDYRKDPYYLKHYAKIISSSLKSNCNLVFSPDSAPIALLETKLPKIFYTDATFAGMLGYYDDYSGLCKQTIQNGNMVEQTALDTANVAIYASDWAAKTAIDNYNINPSKVRVVPFGANIKCDRTLNDIKELVSIRSTNECHLLFVGVNWYRKGGDMAIKVAELLNKNGIKTYLHIVGIKDLPLKTLPEFVINHGFLSKANIQERTKIEQLFSMANFFLLPTLAECYGVVFPEANSFGLPAITTNVGGIPTIIREGINGKTFALTDDANIYAEYIQSVFLDKALYRQMALSSFNEYKTRLNWEVAGLKLKSIFEEVL